MITITKEVADDICKILSAAQHSKYTWQQVTSYIGVLQQKVAEANLLNEPPPPKAALKANKVISPAPKKAKTAKKS